MLDFHGSWAKMTKAAKVNAMLHDFRWPAARNLIGSGVNWGTAKRITGHKTDSMFPSYNITSEDDLADAAAKLEARRIGCKLLTESQQAEDTSVSH